MYDPLYRSALYALGVVAALGSFAGAFDWSAETVGTAMVVAIVTIVTVGAVLRQSSPNEGTPAGRKGRRSVLYRMTRRHEPR